VRAHEVPEVRQVLLDVLTKAWHELQNFPGDAGAAKLADEYLWMHTATGDATLWFVSDAMTDLVAHAWKDVPATTLTPHLLPDPEGLVIFAHPLVGLDAATATPLMVDGYLWGPAELARLGVPPVECISLAPVAHRQSAPALSNKYHSEDYWGPLGHTDWAIGADTDTVTEIEPEDLTPVRVASMVEDRRMMATFWLLASQPNIAEASDAPLPRPVRRREERAGRPAPRVRLVDVRRPRRPPGPPGAHRDVDWSHRWVVRGHWRQQAYGPGRTLHRPRWIAPFVKGPDDKPLVVDETVKVWQR
jgi:hypothetical protein